MNDDNLQFRVSHPRLKCYKSDNRNFPIATFNYKVLHVIENVGIFTQKVLNWDDSSHFYHFFCMKSKIAQEDKISSKKDEKQQGPTDNFKIWQMYIQCKFTVK